MSPERESSRLKSFVDEYFSGIYFAIVLAFSLWVILTGKATEPARQLISFYSDAPLLSTGLSVELFAGFLVLKFFVSTLLLGKVVNRKVRKLRATHIDFGPVRRELVTLKSGSFLLRLQFVLATVLLEETLFRWLPLGLIWPLLGSGKLSMWVLVISSTLVFAAAHIFQYTPLYRSPVVVLPQLASGLFFAFIFLVYGFTAAVLLHLAYNILISVPDMVEVYYLKKKHSVN